MDLVIVGASLGFAGFWAGLVLLGIWWGSRQDDRDPFDGVPKVPVDPEAAKAMAEARAAGSDGKRLAHTSKEDNP